MQADDADLDSPDESPGMPSGFLDSDPVDPDVQLARWRVEAAVDQRRAVRDEMQLLHAEATMDLTLLAVATSQDRVTINTRSGGRLMGRISRVGADVVVLMPGTSDTAMPPIAIRSAHICAIAQTPDGDRSAQRWAAPPAGTATLTFDHLMADLADSQAQVSIRLTGGATISGTIRSLGVDVLVLVDPANRVCYLRLDGLSEVSSMSMTSS